MARQSRAHPEPLPVLLTRPAAQAARFAAQLADRFGARLVPVLSPLIVPRFLTPDVPAMPWAAVVLTSQTGAEAAGHLRQNVPLPDLAYCVGSRTAQAATEAGFRAISADGDADALIALILGAGEAGPLLHLHGAQTRGDVAARLSAGGVECHAAVVYVQHPQPLAPQALAVLQGAVPVVVPLFSPRTAQLFAAAAQDATAPLWIAALGPAVAGACPPNALICTADRPDAGAMLMAIDRLLAGETV
ncbi:MAG: uroporphyrinogen-III synthase [Pseudomonadota bacterium]